MPKTRPSIFKVNVFRLCFVFFYICNYEIGVANFNEISDAFFTIIVFMFVETPRKFITVFFTV